MARTAAYYLSRVVKLGELSAERFRDAILDSATLRFGRYDYTFVQAVEHEIGGAKFIFGKLAKYSPIGHVETVEPEQHAEGRADVRNMLAASSPFVYLAEFGALAYPHIWNAITRVQFERIFSDLIAQKFGGFFVECRIEPITDLKTFAQRLSSLTSISLIQATVVPSNPLFGPAWKALRQYMRERAIAEATFQEKASNSEGLHSKIAEVASTLLASSSKADGSVHEVVAEFSGSLTDAAVLMAADGYGRARVEGHSDARHVVIRTEESQIHFRHSSDPVPEQLYEDVAEHLRSISRQRRLGHPK